MPAEWRTGVSAGVIVLLIASASGLAVWKFGEDQAASGATPQIQTVSVGSNVQQQILCHIGAHDG
jgi:hypothetical protein